MEITLDVQPRTDKGKGPAGRARVAGLVPAVLYGPSVDPQSLYVDAKQMGLALRTEAGANVLINIKVDGESHLTIPREIHRHPIRNAILHVDFVAIARNVKIHAEVPIHLVGESHGVKEGGQLDHLVHTILIEALPGDVPAAIEVDVAALGVGESLTVGDIKVPKGVEILTDPDDLMVSVHEEITLDVEAELDEEAAPVVESEEDESEEPGDEPES